MRVLWFANTPCGAATQLKCDSQGGGWLSSLEERVAASAEVDLHVCFKWREGLSSFQRRGVTYHPVPKMRMKKALLGHLPGFSLPEPVKAHLEVIDRIKPDLVHIHGTEEDFGLIQFNTDIPVLVSIQGVLSTCEERYFSDISWWRFLAAERLVDHVRLKSVLANYPIFKANAARERRIFSVTEHVMGRTAWDRRTSSVLSSAEYHYGGELLRSPFFDGEWSVTQFPQQLRLVTVSNGSPYKGHETVVKVARLLKRAGVNFMWRVAGLPPKAGVAKAVRRWLGEQEEVRLLGPLGTKEVKDLLLDSDIFCQASHIENSSNSLCEAMLLGMPIVASLVGGTDSILADGKEGILVPDRDPWAMAGAIVELSQDPRRAAAMGCAARERALTRHDPDRIVTDLLGTYRRLVGRSK